MRLCIPLPQSLTVSHENSTQFEKSDCHLVRYQPVLLLHVDFRDKSLRNFTHEQSGGRRKVQGRSFEVGSRISLPQNSCKLCSAFGAPKVLVNPRGQTSQQRKEWACSSCASPSRPRSTPWPPHGCSTRQWPPSTARSEARIVLSACVVWSLSKHTHTHTHTYVNKQTNNNNTKHQQPHQQ